MVKEMNIYLAASSRYQASKERKTIYLLEAKVDGVPYTKHEVMRMTETYHGAMVRTLKAAAGRIREPVDVHIYTDDDYLNSRLGELALMSAADFKNRDGTKIAYAGDWQEIAEKIKNAKVEAGEHSYSEWMKHEMEKPMEYLTANGYKTEE